MFQNLKYWVLTFYLKNKKEEKWLNTVTVFERNKELFLILKNLKHC